MFTKKNIKFDKKSKKIQKIYKNTKDIEKFIKKHCEM